MAKVMLRENGGKLYFYVAKKDMEEIVESVEFDSPQKWGGNVRLSNGQIWFIEPTTKELPKEVVARKIADD
jgi:nitrogen fixation protein NifT